MADEQTPNSDLIEDALRQAERQLEERLEALRMSALGEPEPSSNDNDDDVAILRPTFDDTMVGKLDDESGQLDDAEPSSMHSAEKVWREAESRDLVFEPAEATSFSPNLDDEHFHQNLSLEDSSSARQDWDDRSDDSMEDEHSDIPELSDVLSSIPKPSRPSWTPTGRDLSEPKSGISSSASVIPTDDEMQFWAHTKTALRSLQQVTDSMPRHITQAVTEDVERIIHDEVATASASIRLLQQSIQQGLPKVVDRVEGSIEQAMSGPNAAIRQMRDELPAQVDRGTRELREAIKEDFERSSAAAHGTLQRDVSQLEQSIAANVTRMAKTIGDGVAGVEKEVEQLGEVLTRQERGVRAEFDRVESNLVGRMEAAEQQLRDEFIEPTETVRKIDEELPARFGRIERTVTEQVQASQRGLTSLLATLVEVNKSSLERVISISTTLDEERTRRAEDTELVVDTVTTGWEGLAGAIKALYQQNEQIDRRIDAIEKRLAKLRDVERTVDQTLGEFRDEVANLKPAPVVVTVSHPEGEVKNSTRGGWTPDRGSKKKR